MILLVSDLAVLKKGFSELRVLAKKIPPAHGVEALQKFAGPFEIGAGGIDVRDFSMERRDVLDSIYLSRIQTLILAKVITDIKIYFAF